MISGESCKKCGAVRQDEAAFCESCGNPFPQAEGTLTENFATDSRANSFG